MRAPHLFLVIALCAGGCAGPRISQVHYSPPSAAPVRDHISTAQGHDKAVKTALAPEKLNLEIARAEIDALLDELTNTQTALKDFELKVADQTNAANRAIDEKNTAITERDKQAAKVRAIAKRERFFFLLMSGALIWTFRVPLWALVKIVLGLVTKIGV